MTGTWISIDPDNKPIGRSILMWVVAKRQSAAITGQFPAHLDDESDGMIWNGSGYQPDLVTHWMELPEGP